MTISKDTVFAISGGARGITAYCAVALARRYQCRFILIGRSVFQSETEEPAWAANASTQTDLQNQYVTEMMARDMKPHPQEVRQAVNRVVAAREIRQTLRDIHAAGGQAMYVSADVTNRHQLAAALHEAQREMGTVTALLHGAGNLADKRIEQKTPGDFETVWNAKVDGLKNLLSVIPAEQLQHLILFSSAAGFYGNVGQADYAMANEVLNKVAYALPRTHPNCRVCALDWGPWDGGMVTPALREYFADQNIQVISKEAGASVLIHELEKTPSSPQTLIGSPMPPLKVTSNEILRQHTLRRRITEERSPFLAHHVIGGRAVLPMLHALNWIASSCEDLYPGYQFFRCEDYRVLKGIVFDADLAPEYVLQLNEIQKDTGQITFDAVVSSQTQDGKPRYHYKVRIIARAARPAQAHYPAFDLTEVNPVDGKMLYQNGTLFHGPYFQGIQWVLNITEQRMTTRCIALNIPREVQGQFAAQAFDPFIVDGMMQSAVIWARQMRGAGSLPLACEIGEQYAAISPGQIFFVTMDVHESSPNRLILDLTAHDAQGNVYSRVERGQVTISQNLNALFQPYEARHISQA